MNREPIPQDAENIERFITAWANGAFDIFGNRVVMRSELAPGTSHLFRAETDFSPNSDLQDGGD